MARIRSDLKFGTITDNPLAVGATSINSAQFASLPTVAGSDELYLTIDPEGSNREIVKVTAHSAAATVCTVVRGQLNTSAAQHAVGTRWVHGAISTDLVVPCTSSTRPTLGLWAGMRIYETDTNREYVYTGSAWSYRGGGTNPTAARMYRAAAGTLAGGGAYTQIAFDSESYDYGNNANTANGKYTAPESALYDIRSRISIDAPAANERFYVNIFVNAVEASRGADHHDAGGRSIDGLVAADVLALTAGDLVDIRVYASGAARNLEVGAATSYFTVRRV